MTSELTHTLRTRHARDFALDVDPTGRVVAADAAATRLLALRPGDAVQARAAAGSAEKLRHLLAHGSTDAVEVAFAVDGAVVTACVWAAVDDGAVALFGHVPPPSMTTALTEVQESMTELAALHRETARQKKEIMRQRDELRDSSLAVVALHGELSDKATAAAESAEIKSRLVANVSHELRTPLHSILGLARLLLDRSDGPLREEQEKQVRFIRQAAEDLSALVSDLLDLSRLDAGKATLRIETFSVGDFLAALRGSMRPLVPADGRVDFSVDVDAAADVVCETDRGKLGQIVRNLVQNALKFTEAGSIRVSAKKDGDIVEFVVADTGVGIDPRDHGRIFEEFTQVENRLQKNAKGAGLGLSLSKKLAHALGGNISVDSALGKGARFVVRVPVQHLEAKELAAINAAPIDPQRAPILVVEDDRKSIFVYERFLSLAGFQILAARTTDEARALLEKHQPKAIVLDVMLEGEASWSFLAELKNSPRTKDIPVLVVTVTNRENKARALGADEFWLKPLDEDRLLRKLRSLTTQTTTKPQQVLHIDDDESARYLFRKVVAHAPWELIETGDGVEGVRLARKHQPAVIVLDFMLQGMTAFDVLDELKSDPRTRHIPVIISTSHVLPPADRERLAQQTDAILAKDQLSRELALHRIRDALQKVTRPDASGGT